MPTRILPSGVGTSMWPPVQIGSSNWEIWYPLGKVGVEVVLPGEDRAVCDVAVERETCHHPELDGLLVGDGQGPWMAEAHGAGVGVRRIAVGYLTATEHLGRGRQVDVKLKPYDRLVGTLLFHCQMPAPTPDSPAVVTLF